MLIAFVMLVAAANLCLGFAAAMYLGVGPSSWPPKFDFGQRGKAEDTSPHEEHLTSEPEPEAHAAETALEEAAPEDEPAAEALPQHPLAEVLTQLARGFDRFEGELASWDSRRREEALEADALTNSAIELSGLASGYLDQFQASLAALADQRLSDPAALRAREDVNAAANRLSTELSVVCAELGSLQFDAADPSVTGEKLTTALTQVLALLHAARNSLEEPLVDLLGADVHEAALVATLKEQAQTSLLGRLALEHVWQTSEVQRMSGEPGAIAMLDVDSLRSLNAQHGPLVARRALAAIGRIASEVVGAGVVVARLLGKQFVISLPHQSPQAAAETIERIRQQIEHTRLRAGDVELDMTASAAVVVAEAEDTPSLVLDRLRSTIREAKSYGRNRTFLWEGNAPTPVLPPKLNVESRTIDL